jgi:hypothetical protein
MITILMIKAFILAYFITRFQPIEMLLEILPDKLIFNILKLAFSCSKCCVFYTSLVYTHNFYYSVLNSFIMIIFERTIGKWERRIEF